MKVPVYVDLGSKEIDVDLSWEDIVNALPGDVEATRHGLSTALTRAFAFMKAVPDDVIRSYSPEANAVIVGWFEEQAKRFREVRA